MTKYCSGTHCFLNRMMTCMMQWMNVGARDRLQTMNDTFPLPGAGKMSDTNDTQALPQLEEAIRRFESDRRSSAAFAPALERRYRRETAGVRSRMLLVQGIIAVLAYDCFIVGDYLMAPTHLVRSAVIRFGVVTPAVFLIALLLRWKESALLRELSASLLCVVAAGSILYMHHGVDAIVSSLTQTGLIMVLLIANCMLRLELPFAILTSVGVLCLDIFFLSIDPHLLFAQKMTFGGILMWITVLSLTANYTLTRERRYSYLLQLRGRLQRGLLAGANAELLALSSTDRLTNLPNRRAYDERLSLLWHMSVERQEPLSAVMVDVDHFKRLNDAHGHPFGDRVLQRVASLLQQALREEDDFVARFGGEEFIVLLPNAEPEAALKVAERIRTLVQVAGSPAVQRETPLSPHDVWTTVSCGVATAWPGTWLDSGRLIADADAALYRAKHEGRNRVCCAAEAPSSSKVTMFPGAAARA